MCIIITCSSTKHCSSYEHTVHTNNYVCVLRCVSSCRKETQFPFLLEGINVFEPTDFQPTVVSQFMRTNIPDIFSAGDVTSFPLSIRGHQRVNVAHWQMSQAQGQTCWCSVTLQWKLMRLRFNVSDSNLRTSSCSKYAEETHKNWVGSFLLDCFVWEEYQIRR